MSKTSNAFIKQMESGICARCHLGFMHCTCENYHPVVDSLRVSLEVINALHEYFYKRAGYISPEFDPIVLEFVKDIDIFLKEQGK